eukprot:9008574-Pyramimonas_sp.AAC.2
MQWALGVSSRGPSGGALLPICPTVARERRPSIAATRLLPPFLLASWPFLSLAHCLAVPPRRGGSSHLTAGGLAEAG